VAVLGSGNGGDIGIGGNYLLSEKRRHLGHIYKKACAIEERGKVDLPK